MANVCDPPASLDASTWIQYRPGTGALQMTRSTLLRLSSSPGSGHSRSDWSSPAREYSERSRSLTIAPSETISAGGSIHVSVARSASTEPSTCTHTPRISFNMVIGDSSSSTTIRLVTVSAASTSIPFTSRRTELARLTRPQPCLGDGGGSMGSPFESVPLSGCAPLMMTALRSAAEGTIESAGTAAPVG